jgi:hypothetical protein
MIHKTFIETDSGLVARVTFTLPDRIWADAIYLVGDFVAVPRDWNRTSHLFLQDREGRWSITWRCPATWSWAGPSSSATCVTVKCG